MMRMTLPFYLPLLLAAMILTAWPASSSARQNKPRLLDPLNSAESWTVIPSDDVSASLAAEDHSLRLDFDFNGVSGYASLRRKLPIRFSGNFALSLQVRGDSSPNTLQMKLIDSSGDNVWWINRPDMNFTREWQTVRAERRQIEFAWGPAQDRTLRRTAEVEITVAAGKGGEGRIEFRNLRLEPLPQPPAAWPTPVVRASSALPDGPAEQALDGNPATAWKSDPEKGPRQILEIDFLVPRSFGGLVLHWLPHRQAASYQVQFSDDGREWRTVRKVVDGREGVHRLLLTESHTRRLRLVLEDGPSGHYGLSEVEIRDLAWGASPNVFFQELAKTERRGFYPRSFSGE